MRLKQGLFGVAMVVVALCGTASATVTTIHQWDIGDGLDGGVAGNAVSPPLRDNVGSRDLNLSGSATWSADTGHLAATTTGIISRLSADLGGGFYGPGVSGSQDYGMEIWAKTESSSQDANILFPSGWNSGFGGGKGGYGLVQNGGNWRAVAPNVAWVGQAPATPGVWTHLAAVLEGNNVARFYVDGVLAARAVANPNETGGGLHMGVNSGGGSYFNGLIDHARIFNFAPGEFSPEDLLLDRFNVARSNRVLANPAAAVFQSSTAHGGAATRAIDGNRSQFWGSGSITHTDGSDDDPTFWQLNFLDQYWVDEVRLYNRVEGGLEQRLSNYHVSLLLHGNEVWGQDFHTPTGRGRGSWN